MWIIITILSALIAAYIIIKELVWLCKDYRIELYIYWDKYHSKQHVAMLIWLLIFLIAMNVVIIYNWKDYITILIYNILIVPFTVKHLAEERINPNVRK